MFIRIKILELNFGTDKDYSQTLELAESEFIVIFLIKNILNFGKITSMTNTKIYK